METGIRHAPSYGHLVLDPNPLAAVRAKQDVRSASSHRKRCSSPRATRWCPSRKNRFRFLFHLPVLRTAIDSVRFRKPSLGGLPRDRRFAPPRASSLPLPPSPTGSGAWTYRRGPGDHSTPRRTTGIPKQVSALRRVWAPLANPNRLAAVRCNQSKLNAVRCFAVQEQRGGVPREKIFFLSRFRANLHPALRASARFSGGLPHDPALRAAPCVVAPAPSIPNW